MNTDQFAREIQKAIEITIDAHTNHGKTEKAKIRYWDQLTPYAVHPIWCAVTLLTETLLPEDIRLTGYQALLWHDVLEDTTFALPVDVNLNVRALIEEMTFPGGYDEEKRLLWNRSDLTKLLKLYDKVSNLLDDVWMSDEKWNDQVAHALRLTDIAEKIYGNLNIVKISRAICLTREIGK